MPHNVVFDQANSIFHQKYNTGSKTDPTPLKWQMDFSVSARARFDPVKSSVDATEVSQCIFRDPTKLPPLKCLKNPVNTQLSVKRAWDISVLKYIYRYYRFLTPDNPILSHLFLEQSASLSVRVTTDAWESKWLTARYESMTNLSSRGWDQQ